MAQPHGRPTRGTTGTNRLRRIDRWICRHPVARAMPLTVVDLGFGASPVTTLELADRLANAGVRATVVGVEIDEERVAHAEQYLKRVRDGGTRFAPSLAVEFRRGGFNFDSGDLGPVDIIRASNVLRQYSEAEVADAWGAMSRHVRPGGIVIDGTCDELGRVSTWVEVDDRGAARTFTASLRLTGLESALVLAERLPKALIHHNVPGEPVHDFLSAIGQAWTHNASLSPFGARQRWLATVTELRQRGVAVLGDRSQWRLGEISVPWTVVSPAGPDDL